MSNNFTSGMAGPAAVETLNLLWDRVTGQIAGNSTTSLAIGTGAKTLTIEASKQFALGQTARITYNSDINKWMQGTVSAYNASTGELSVVVDAVGGSGTYAAWTVAMTGAIGPMGPEPSGFLRYQGMATPATTPTATADYLYIATTPGTYANFGGLVVGNEIAHLHYTGSAWVKTTIYSFDNARSVGRAIYGAIYPVETTSGSTFTFRVCAGTVIEESHGTANTPNSGVFTLSAQTLEITTNDNYCYLYATRAGVLGYAASIDAVPAGGVLLFYRVTIYTYFQGILPSNHQFGSAYYSRSCYPIPVETFNIKSLGAVGDGVSDDSVPYSLLQNMAYFWVTNSGYLWSKAVPPITVYFPSGTYLMDNLRQDINLRILGDGKTQTIIKSYSEAAFAFGKSAPGGYCENLGFHNVPVMFPSFVTGKDVVFKNVKFTWTADVTGGSTYCAFGNPRSAHFEGVDFDFLGTVYAGLWLYEYERVTIRDCTFAKNGTGAAWHNIRLSDPLTSDASAEIYRNAIYNGTTGIFLGSNRARPTQNVLIERNYLYGQGEESISLDGFGNNSGLCPVICNGPITAVSNDGNGRLVVGFTMTYATNDIGTPGTYTVSSRSDWTNFYLSFGEGSNLEGVYARIVSYDTGASTLTCDLRTPAANVTVGGDCGVQSGFFHCIVRDNVIQGSVGASNNSATGISVYLNVFGTRVENNTVIGCHQGILIGAGLMLSTYRTLAYNNVVTKNTLLACGQVAGGYPTVRFESLYGGGPQYGNVFAHNTVKGGRVYLEKQQNMIFKDNIIEDATLTLSYMANTLPTADATQIGRTFMKITDDGSGNPTTIEYYVCKLASGTYSWVAV